MNEKKRVLYIIGSLETGGAERQMALLARNISVHGYTPKVFVLKRTPGKVLEELLAAGIPVIDGKCNHASSKNLRIYFLFRAVLILIKECLRFKPDIIHSFLPLTNFIAVICGKLLMVKKVVVSKRSLSLYQDKSKLWKFLDFVSSNYCTTLVGNSKAVIDDTIKRDKIKLEKCKVVYNALREEFFELPTEPQSSHSKNRIVIICIANLIPYKGHAELITAFSKVLKSNSLVELWLVGEDRNLGPSLKKMAKELSIEESIKFMGKAQDIPKLVRQADIGILTSHEEGFSNAIIEMLSGGLPIIATRVGGTPEALTAIPDCILIEPKSSIEIENALNKTIANLEEIKLRSELRARLAQATYSIKAMTTQYAEIYKN